jgi:hypothetical protein
MRVRLPDAGQHTADGQEPTSPMARWLAIESEARALCRRLELDPAHDLTARRLLGLWYAGRLLIGETLR